MFEKKQMFKAVCSNCGDNCEVPFKPTGSKPVLCSNCFGEKGGNRNQGRGDRDRRSFDRGGRSGDRSMHKATCDNCGNDCEVPFKPTAGKPIYCNDCFSKKNQDRDRRGGGGRDRNRDGGGGNDQVAQQLKDLNSKIDQLMGMLGGGKKEATSKVASKKPTVEKKPKSKVVKKPAKKIAKKKK